MRYTDPIGSQDDFIERKLNRPKYYACPECGKKGKRKRVVERFVGDDHRLGHLPSYDQ